jgi:predicted nuclease of predicted toxin-antitoxin system
VQNHNQIQTPGAYQYMQQENLYNKEKINQALGECTAWLTTLNLLKDESYSLKTKLSEALDNNTDRELIAEAENYHTLIITRDEYIRDIAADTKSQEKKLKEAALKNIAEKQWNKLQQKLRNEIAYLEKDFAAMKEDFYRKFLKKPYHHGS